MGNVSSVAAASPEIGAVELVVVLDGPAVDVVDVVVVDVVVVDVLRTGRSLTFVAPVEHAARTIASTVSTDATRTGTGTGADACPQVGLEEWLRRVRGPRSG